MVYNIPILAYWLLTCALAATAYYVPYYRSVARVAAVLVCNVSAT